MLFSKRDHPIFPASAKLRGNNSTVPQHTIPLENGSSVFPIARGVLDADFRRYGLKDEDK